MVGRCTASAIASASRKSFFCPLCVAYLAWQQDHATFPAEETPLSAEQQAETVRIGRRLWSETKVLVAERWPAIELIVHELRQRQVLSGDEIDGLIKLAE
jgi:hypothetical protein